MTPPGRPLGQIACSLRELGGHLALEAGRDFVGARRGGGDQRRPAVDAERVGAAEREVGAGLVHARQRLADLAAMDRLRPTQPDAVEKGDDRRGAAGEAAERLAVLRPDRLRAGDAALGEMLHQADEERQVALVHPLFVEREDELAGVGVQQVVGVLDPFGDALEGEDAAEVVASYKSFQRLVGDFSVNGHDASAVTLKREPRPLCPRAGRGDTARRSVVMGRRSVRKLAVGRIHALRLGRPDGAQRHAARADWGAE